MNVLLEPYINLAMNNLGAEFIALGAILLLVQLLDCLVKRSFSRKFHKSATWISTCFNLDCEKQLTPLLVE